MSEIGSHKWIFAKLTNISDQASLKNYVMNTLGTLDGSGNWVAKQDLVDLITNLSATKKTQMKAALNISGNGTLNANEAGNEGQNFKAILQSGLFDDIAELDSYKAMLKKASTADAIPSIEQTMARAKKYLDEGGNKSLIKFEDNPNNYDVDFGIKSSDGVHTYETAFQFKGTTTLNAQKIEDAAKQLTNASALNKVCEFKLKQVQSLSDIQADPNIIDILGKRLNPAADKINLKIHAVDVIFNNGSKVRITFANNELIYTNL